MKKLTFKSLLLLCALIVGSNSLWAADENISCSSSSPYLTGANFTISYGKNSGSDPVYNAGDGGLRLYVNNYLSIAPKNGETITAVTLSVKCNQGGSSGNKAYPTSVTANEETITSGGTPGSNVTSIVWSGSTTSTLTFTVNGSKGNVAVKSISITYTPSVPSAPTITSQPVGGRYIRAAKEVSNLSISATPSTGSSCGFQWYSNTTSAATIDAEHEIDGATTSTYAPSVSTAGTTYYYCVVSDDGSNTTTSDVVAVSVLSGIKNYKEYSGELTEGDYLVYQGGGAMNTTLDGSKRLQYEEVTPVHNVISSNDESIVWNISQSGNYWTLYNSNADKYAASTGTKSQAAIIADGTDDKALWTVSGTSTYEFVNKYNSANSVNANLRRNGTYGFACYAVGTGTALSLYKSSLSVKANSGKWFSFCPSEDVDIPAGVTAYYAELDGSGDLVTHPITATTIKAGEGVLLKAASDFTFTSATSDADWVAENALLGTWEEVAVDLTNYDYYVLAEVSETIGFYKFAPTAESKKYIPANKAYYRVAKSNLAPSVIRIVDEENGATDIKAVEGNENTVKFFNNGMLYIVRDGVTYDLMGRRVK